MRNSIPQSEKTYRPGFGSRLDDLILYDKKGKQEWKGPWKLSLGAQIIGVPGGKQLIGLGRRQGAGAQCSSLDWG